MMDRWLEQPPWPLFETIKLDDVNGSIRNLTGFELYVATLVRSPLERYRGGIPNGRRLAKGWRP